MNRYRLLKPLPNLGVGELFEWDKDIDMYASVNYDFLDKKTYYSRAIVENDSIWFELIPEPSKENKEWKILTCFNTNKKPHIVTGKTFHPYTPKSDDSVISNCDDDKCEIHSVKRLSDGVVFSVGDDFIYCGIPNRIKGFSISANGNAIHVHFGYAENVTSYAMLNDIKLPPSKKQETITSEQIVDKHYNDLIEIEKQKQEPKEDVFTWDEDSAKEYGKFCVLNHSWLQWEDFKQSKKPSKAPEAKVVTDRESLPDGWKPMFDLLNQQPSNLKTGDFITGDFPYQPSYTESKERVEVESVHNCLEYQETLGEMHIFKRTIQVRTNAPIDKKKFPAIKKAIEKVLNDDKEELPKYIPNPEVEKLIVKKYTQQQMDEEIKKAFNASRQNDEKSFELGRRLLKYPTLQDYLKTIKP